MHHRRRNALDALGGLLITVVALALLAPVFGGLRSRSDARICLSNLQRIGTAARMYEDDYDGMLVPYAVSSLYVNSRYTSLLYPYLRDARVFSCPADHLGETQMAGNPPYPSTYGVNWYISQMAGTTGSTLYPGRHRSFVQKPSATIWAADTAIIARATAHLPADQWKEDLAKAPTAEIYYFYLPQNSVTGVSDPNWNGGWAGIVRPFPRHGGRVNVGFYDGHAGSVPASQFDPNVTKWGTPECLWDNPMP